MTNAAASASISRIVNDYLLGKLPLLRVSF